jgi:phosphatidylglycerol---prolipoprotein diacylglyceryl transferase
MLTYPHINPVAFSAGPVKVHWYGLMYLLAFSIAWCLGQYRKKQHWTPVNTMTQVSDILFYGIIGVLLGGRIGYMLFYDFFNFIHHPWIIIQVWDGGMSFHGGLIGSALGMIYAKYKLKCRFLDLTDFFAPIVPLGLFCGRIGNFINGELWGRVTTSKIGMVFPNAGPLPRYPSQLIEASLEGILLFVILWIYSLKPRKSGALSAWFLILYGIFRITVEFFRQPDSQIGFIAWGWLTMGQLLSLPLILVGIILLIIPFKKSSNQDIKQDNTIAAS